jgi:hypothetical protein
VITNAQLAYSKRFYGKPLCRTCQILKVTENNKRVYDR